MGDVDQRDGKAMTEYIGKMLHWRDEFLDIPINQLKKIATSTGYNRVVFVEHTWKQLKKSVEWYEEQCGLVSFKEDVILREIDLQRISGSSASPFKRSDLLYLNNHKREPIETVDYSKNLCPILIYEKINPKIAYILSVDPSEGLAQDNNAFTLINPYTQLPVAEFRSPYISPPDYTKLMIDFMDKRCPKSMIVVEANKGREIINRILETKYKYQLWYDIDKLNAKIVDSTDEYGALRQAANERRAYGFDTTSSSRPKLFGLLETFVEEEKEKLYTQYIVEDTLGLVRNQRGRIEASSGKHDDNILCFLIGMYVYYNASNLEEFGIRRGARAPEEVDTKDPVYIKEKMKNLLGALPAELQDLFNGIIKQKDPVDEAQKYEKVIQDEMRRQKYEKIVDADKEDISLNEYNEQEWSNLDQAIFDSNLDDEKFRVNIDDYL